MRRLPALLLLTLALGLMTIAPVSAELPPYVELAVPGYVPVDGELDMIVVTGGASDLVAVLNCFPVGDYPRVPVVIQDRTAKVAGRVTGIIVNLSEGEVAPGTRAINLFFNGTCTEPDGTGYRKYIGVLEVPSA